MQKPAALAALLSARREAIGWLTALVNHWDERLAVMRS
jgi:hypothetical protein